MGWRGENEGAGYAMAQRHKQIVLVCTCTDFDIVWFQAGGTQKSHACRSLPLFGQKTILSDSGSWFSNGPVDCWPKIDLNLNSRPSLLGHRSSVRGHRF